MHPAISRLRALAVTPLPAIILMTACATDAVGEISTHRGVNLPGHDYRDFDLPRADPHACRFRCAGDHRCKAYTYVKPGVQGPKAHCWLKHSIPQTGAVRDSNTISGLRRFKDRMTLLPSINIPGGDYPSGYPVKSAIECKSKCMADRRCFGFTFVKPGIQGPEGKCWIKNRVRIYSGKGRVRDQCCISGIKQIEVCCFDKGGRYYWAYWDECPGGVPSRAPGSPHMGKVKCQPFQSIKTIDRRLAPRKIPRP